MQADTQTEKPKEHDLPEALPQTDAQRIDDLEQQLSALVEISSDFYWETDEQHRFKLLKGPTFEKWKFDTQPLYGKTRWELPHTYPVSDGGSWEIHKAKLAAREPIADFLYKYVNARGELRYTATSGRPIFDAHGRFKGYRGLGRDVTAGMQMERRLTLEREVTRVLTDALTWTDATRRIIERICETLGWACGAHWAVDEENRSLLCTDVWGTAAPGMEEFLAATRNMTPLPASGDGLVRRTFMHGEPQWILNVTKKPTYLRAPQASAAKLRSAFAFPIKAGAKTIGVMEFYSRETAHRADDELLRGAAQLGVTIGQFFQRRSTEEELLRFRAVIDIAPDNIHFIDPEAMRFLYVNETNLRLSGWKHEDYEKMSPSEISGVPVEELKRLYAEVIAKKGESVTGEMMYKAKSGLPGWFETQRRAVRLGDKWIILTISREITSRKLAEKSAAWLSRMYATLGATNEAIMHSKSSQELYQRACDAAVQGGEFLRAAVLLTETDGSRLRIAASGGTGAEQLPDVAVDETQLEGQGLVGTAFRTGAPCVSNDFMKDERVRPWHADAEQAGIRAGAAVPLLRAGCTIGVLLLHSNEKRAFDDKVVTLLERMAENIVFALDNFDHEGERKHAEEALRASEEKYRAVLENMHEGFWEVDLDGNFTSFNDAQCRVLGYDRAEMAGLNYRRYYEEENVRRVHEIFTRMYQTRKPEQMTDLVVIRKDGTRATIESSVQLICDAHGNPVGFRGVTRDATARRRAEEALRESGERFRSLTDLSSDWFWELDTDFRFTKFEGKGGGPGGYDAASAIIGKCAWELPGVDRESADWDAHREACRRHESFRDFEYAYRDHDARLNYMNVNGAPVFDKDGAFLGYRGTSRDITKRKHEERLLTLEHAVARGLADADSTHKILQTVMRLVCESEQWESAGYWTVDERAQTLRLTMGWNGAGNPTATREYYKDSLGVTIAADGPLGNVWKTAKPLWVGSVVRDSSTQWHQRFRHSSEHSSFSFPVMADGKVIGLLGFAGAIIHEPDERLLRTVGVIGNQVGQFLQRKQAQRVLRESEARFRALTELSSDWYWEQDTEFRFTRVESRRGDNDVSRQFLIGKRDWETGYEIETDGGWDAHRALHEAHEPYRDAVMHRTLPDGTRYYISVSGEPIFDDKGRFKGYRGVSREITEQKLAEERIQYLATHDGLTSLPNRVLFAQLLSNALASARRYNRGLAVLFIDLDRFKLINDTLGHDAGDQLLQEIGQRLRQTLRDSDVIARLGGDEFVVLVPEVGEPNQVAIIARKILSTVIRPILLAGQECRVTASIGIAMYPGDGEDEQSLMRNADIAMYHAKEEGKNNFQFHSTQIKSQSLERLTLETQLRRALEQNEFSLRYQAKLDLKTDTINGVEALLRWQNPQLGSIPPVQFIPLAEETGLIVPIGRWVLRTACAQNVAWQRQGLPPVCMAVNLSARQFSDENLLDDIAAALKDSDMEPRLLELEITEGMVIHNPKRAIETLTAIKQMGVRLAIDDFGTGYSSLGQLKNFPIDTLKIDRSFIREIPTDAEDKAITQAIIAMGKTLSLTVVAEGVETEAQENFLRENACDEMQGYYFSKPVHPDQFAALLRDHVPANSSAADPKHNSTFPARANIPASQ